MSFRTKNLARSAFSRIGKKIGGGLKQMGLLKCYVSRRQNGDSENPHDKGRNLQAAA